MAKVYKYYSFDSHEYWKWPLLQKLLFFSRYSAFNDPYEFHFKLNKEGSFETKIKFLKEGNPESEHIQNLKTEKDVENYLKELNTDFAYSGMKTFFNSFGLCSFSKTPDVLLMWSHYSKGHTGFCLEFDTEKLDACAEGEDKINWVNVEYVSTVPELSIFSSPTFDKYLKFKSDCWSYEQEVRAYRLPTPYKITTDCITRVIAGVNSFYKDKESSAYKDLQNLKEIIKKEAPHLMDNLAVANKDDNQFKVNINKVDFNWLI